MVCEDKRNTVMVTFSAEVDANDHADGAVVVTLTVIVYRASQVSLCVYWIMCVCDLCVLLTLYRITQLTLLCMQ